MTSGEILHVVVSGSSGLGEVVGISSTHPAALLQAVKTRAGQHLILLAPWYAAAAARAQAHVVIAASPGVRVCVLALQHHPLTLTLLAAAVLDSEGSAKGWSDPGEAVQLLRQSAARSRSIVWQARVLRLREPAPSLSQRARSLLRASGFFAEIGAPAGLVDGRAGLETRPGEVLYTPGDVPLALLTQLGATARRAVNVTVGLDGHYGTKAAVQLAGLVGPVSAPISASPCPSCSASLALQHSCPFCGGARAGELLVSLPGSSGAQPRRGASEGAAL